MEETAAMKPKSARGLRSARSTSSTYRKEAAEDGWKRLLAWFKQHGVA
jgi:dienelactone hydrolase